MPQKPKQEETEPKEKQLLDIKLKKIKEKKLPEAFLSEIKEFLAKKDIELIGELKVDKKDVIGKIRINSDLDKISLLLVAKDKKKINLADLSIAYQSALHEKMPCYFSA